MIYIAIITVNNTNHDIMILVHFLYSDDKNMKFYKTDLKKSNFSEKRKQP